MRIGAIPEGMVERLANLAGLAPTPVVDTFHAVIVARAVVVATRLGIFDAIAAEPLSASNAAARLGLDPRALEKLLNILVATGYLAFRDGRYRATRLARKWLLADSPQSLRDNMLLRVLEWEAIAMTEDFVRTGVALDVHERIAGDQWSIYQRGMRSLARFSAGEVAARLKLPPAPTAMLDIGGGHGTYSVAFCRRHSGLAATILDLPEAVATAAPLLAEEGLGARVVHRAGNALSDDLGEHTFDLVFASHLVHHFDAAQNLDLMVRAGRALKPGGVLAILDVLRPEAPGEGGQTGALLDLYFALTSNAGTWSKAEITGWFTRAGLAPAQAIALWRAPGLTVLTARTS